MDSAVPTGWRFVLVGALWGVLGASVCAWMAGLEPNLLEEGIVLHLAQRMVGGEHLFRELASFTGPFPFELLALLFRFFGDDVVVARSAVAIMHGVASSAAFGIARAGRSGAFAHLAAACVVASPVLLFPLFSLYFYSVTAFHLSLYAAWAVTRGLGLPRWLVLGGALVALVALCKQNVGAALALALALAIAASAPRGERLGSVARFAFGGAVVAVATLLLYGLRGDIEPLFRSLVVLPLSFGDSFDARYMNFWPPGEFREDVYIDRARYVPALYGFRYGVFGGVGFAPTLLTQLLYGLPFVAIALTLISAFRNRAEDSFPGASGVHLALLVALVTNLFPRTDWGHLVYVLPASVVQLCLLAGRSRRPLGAATPWFTAVLVAGLMVSTASLGQWLRLHSANSAYGPKLPLRPVSDMMKAQALPRLVNFLRQNAAPGEPIFVPRAEPLIYFATGLSNPTPYSGVIPGMREEQERIIIEALPGVRYVVMSDIDQPAYLFYSDELPAVWNELERHYRVARGSPPGWLTLLERGPDRGVTAIDLFDRRDSGRRWIRDSGGAPSPSSEPAPRLAATLNRRPLAFRIESGGGGIDFDIDVPERALFQSGVGLWQTVGLTSRYEHPRRVAMVVSVAPAGDESFEQLVARDVLTRAHRGFTWLPLEADLSAYAGRRVTLRLELQPRGLLGEERLAWFGSPRVALAIDP